MQTRRETLSKSERLRSESRIDALFNAGRRGFVEPLKYCWLAVDGKAKGAEEAKAEAAKEAETPVSVLFSVPKKVFNKAWKRNLIKRRMRESYRRRKHELCDAVRAAGQHIDIALICMPESAKATKGAKKAAVKAAATNEIPDFVTIDNAIAKILEQITARNRT